MVPKTPQAKLHNSVTCGSTNIKHTQLGFYITNLGHNQIILGHPWFQTFNPIINWTTNQLQDPDMQIKTAGYQTKLVKKVALQTIEPTPPTTDNKEEEKIDPSQNITTNTGRSLARKPHISSHQWEPHNHIKPGTPNTLDCKIYKQTETELQATRDFVCEVLTKGSIQESNSPYASPLFYCAKKDRKLHPIMNYKVLNSWTVHDM